MTENSLILKNSAILFFRLIVTSILGLFTTRLLVRGLGASDFGLYSVVGGVVVMMAFLNTVMITTTFRFIAFEMGKNNINGVNKVFNISLAIHLILGFIVVLLTETVGIFYVNNYLNIDPGKLFDARFVLRFSTYATVFTIISIPFQGLITAQEKFSVRASIEIIRAVLLLLVALSIYAFSGNKLRYYALLMMIVSSIVAFLFILYGKIKYRDFTKWEVQKDRVKYLEMIQFSGWIMFGAAASVGKTQGSALIINSFFGTLLNAAYGIAIQVNNLVQMIASNLGQAVVPQITKSFSGGNTQRSVRLVAYTSKYTCFLMLIPAYPILLETEYLLKIWLGDIPPYTIIFCQLIIINSLIDSLGGGIPALIQATGKIKYFQIILSTTSLISIPIAWFLFKVGYSPSYLIIAFVSTAFLNVILRQVLLKKIIDFDVEYFLKTSYLKIFYVVLLILPLFFLRDLFNPGLSRFLIFSLIGVSWLFFVVYVVGIEKNEKNMIKQIVLSFVNKNRENE